ncbi:hypothetical protein NEIELOOT_02020 [Neisseria elongata subsp. glycolytica ATCC 29315]|uniref:Uncharacterized protein n=1 Tax=Neisseria elongata subsp. glycolytica ATCC 29315 TaxID=546263 RepID=D4DSH5_NEIEG|nr:hypothetical protein NEIELOOT_02020 [Neisseria elongata subsp. glycolytica ATCC 29315]
MVRSANLKKFKSPLITDYFPYISVQKITHFLSNQSKSWCKFFPAPALLKPTPHKDFRRFFLLPTQCKINTSPHFSDGLRRFASSFPRRRKSKHERAAHTAHGRIRHSRAGGNPGIGFSETLRICRTVQTPACAAGLRQLMAIRSVLI